MLSVSADYVVGSLHLADSHHSLIGMVAAGRGVYVGPEFSIRGRREPWRSAGDIYVLTEHHQKGRMGAQPQPQGMPMHRRKRRREPCSPTPKLLNWSKQKVLNMFG